MSIVSVKVRSDIKDKMMKYRDRVDWSQEIREFNHVIIGENMIKAVLKVREKGVLILPKSLREAAGINEGEVTVEAREGATKTVSI